MKPPPHGYWHRALSVKELTTLLRQNQSPETRRPESLQCFQFLRIASQNTDVLCSRRSIFIDNILGCKLVKWRHKTFCQANWKMFCASSTRVRLGRFHFRQRRNVHLHIHLGALPRQLSRRCWISPASTATLICTCYDHPLHSKFGKTVEICR